MTDNNQQTSGEVDSPKDRADGKPLAASEVDNFPVPKLAGGSKSGASRPKGTAGADVIDEFPVPKFPAAKPTKRTGTSKYDSGEDFLSFSAQHARSAAIHAPSQQAAPMAADGAVVAATSEEPVKPAAIVEQEPKEVEIPDQQEPEKAVPGTDDKPVPEPDGTEDAAPVKEERKEDIEQWEKLGIVTQASKPTAKGEDDTFRNMLSDEDTLPDVDRSKDASGERPQSVQAVPRKAQEETVQTSETGQEDVPVKKGHKGVWVAIIIVAAIIAAIFFMMRAGMLPAVWGSDPAGALPDKASDGTPKDVK